VHGQEIYTTFCSVNKPKDVLSSLQSRAGSWSLQAMRLEGDCGPLVGTFAILTLF